MKKPVFLAEGEQAYQIARVFNTPLVVRGDISALPLSELAVFAYFFRRLDRQFPGLERHQRVVWSVRCALLLLGSEWCHNLAHAFVSARIRKPVDAIRVNFGMPLLIFFDPDDPQVKPAEHMLRSIGGPIFNILTLLPLLVLKNKSPEGTPDRFAALLAFDTNLFLSIAGLSPLPFLDGGPLLKWSLIQNGRSPQKAEQIVKQANGASALIFTLTALLAKKRGKGLLSILLALLGISSLAIALGWIEDAY